MTSITANRSKSQGRRTGKGTRVSAAAPSIIDALQAKRRSIWHEFERLDKAQGELRHDTSKSAEQLFLKLETQKNRILCQDMSIVDAMALQTPRTVCECVAVLQAASFHIDFMANGAVEHDDVQAREDRVAKAEHAVAAVVHTLAKLEGLETVGPEFVFAAEDSEELLAAAEKFLH